MQVKPFVGLQQGVLRCERAAGRGITWGNYRIAGRRAKS